MNPYVKYTIGRTVILALCLLAAVFALPSSLNPFLIILVALGASAAISYFLLRPWRDEVANHLVDARERRLKEKERLRAALAGEDEPPADKRPGPS